MSNLIITIISLAIFGVAAAMGIYYGGIAYKNARINVTANAIVNEAQQILLAERMWSNNNGQSDISGMGAAGSSGTGMSMLVNQHYLTTWPFVSSLIPRPFPIHGGNTLTTGTCDRASSYSAGYNIGGYTGDYQRVMFSWKNGNYVAYILYQNASVNGGQFASSTSDVSQINHPIVQIAKAINAATGQVSLTAKTSSAIGVPTPGIGWNGNEITWNPPPYDTSGYADADGEYTLFLDASGALMSNACYMNGSTTINIDIECVFGPS